MLNYNSITQEMIFLQNGAYLALGQLENIDTVYIAVRKFTPVKDVFYEVATETPVPLLINHKCKVMLFTSSPLHPLSSLLQLQ